ncbi:MAG: YfhO family protein [Planctomycetes bacterium]|nr:YfhO family protein [Planctomycetota bacterium]
MSETGAVRVRPDPAAAPPGGPRPGELIAMLGVFVLLVAAIFPEVTLGNRTVSCAPLIPFTLPAGPVGISRPSHLPLFDPFGPGWIKEATFPYVERALTAGQWPLWNPHVACGNPYFAGLLHGLVFPTNLLKFAAAAPRGFELAYLARVVLAGWLLYTFLRVHRLRRSAAFVGGVLYLGCGYILGGMTLPDVTGEAMIPGTLLAAEWVVVGRRRRDLVLAVILLWLTLMSGNPESIFLAVAFGGLYGAARALSLPQATWIRSVALLATAHLLAALLAAPQLLPFLEFVSRSAHTHQAGDNIRVVPWQTLILWIVPGFFRHAYTGLILPTCGGFYGIASLGWILALAAPGHRAHRFLGVFSGATLLAAGAWYFGAPGFVHLSRLPLLNQIQLHKYVAVYLCLTPGVLAAVGLDRLLALPARAAANRLLVGAAAVGAFVAAFVLAWSAGGLRLAGSLLRLGPEHPVAPSLGVLSVLLAVVGLGYFLLQSRPRLKTGFLLLLMALVPVEVALHAPRGFPERADIYRAPTFLHALEGDRRTFRVYSPDAVLHPNTAAIFGLNDIRYAEALKIDRYVRLIERGFPYPAARHYFPTHEAPIRRRVPVRMLTLLGVRYVLADGALDPIGPLPPGGNARADITVDPSDGPLRLVGEIEVAPGRGGSLRLWHPRTETAAILEEAEIPAGAGVAAVRLRSPAAAPGTLFYLGLEIPGGYALAFESLEWCGRPVPPGAIRSGSLRADAIAAGAPLRIRSSTLVALPAPPAGAEPEVFLRGRRGAKPVRVALAAQEGEALHTVEFPPAPGAAPRSEVLSIALDALPPRPAPLSVEVAGDITVRELSCVPASFAARGRFEGVGVFEHPEALPRAFGVHGAEVIPDDDAQLARILDRAFPLRTSVVLAAPPREFALPAQSPRTPPRVAWRTEEPGGSRIELDVEFAAAGLLVLHDSWYPGWKAAVDGRPAEVLRANFAFRAVAVPAGAHRVTFTYAPLSLRLGLLAAAAAILALVAVCWCWRGRISRRQPPQEGQAL